MIQSMAKSRAIEACSSGTSSEKQIAMMRKMLPLGMKGKATQNPNTNNLKFT